MAYGKAERRSLESLPCIPQAAVAMAMLCGDIILPPVASISTRMRMYTLQARNASVQPKPEGFLEFFLILAAATRATITANEPTMAGVSAPRKYAHRNCTTHDTPPTHTVSKRFFFHGLRSVSNRIASGMRKNRGASWITVNAETSRTLSSAGDYLIQPIKQAVKKYSLKLVNNDSRIVCSKLHEKTGIIGACMTARRQMFERN